MGRVGLWRIVGQQGSGIRRAMAPQVIASPTGMGFILEHVCATGNFPRTFHPVHACRAFIIALGQLLVAWRKQRDTHNEATGSIDDPRASRGPINNLCRAHQ